MTPSLDPRSLRTAFGQFATGIAIATTTAEDGQPVGLTINSFSSVSLDPPLALWSLSLASLCLPAFRACRHFAINVLAADQVELSNRFATTATDRFGGLAWRPGLGGAPLLSGCCAQFECTNEAQHPGGDHLIFVGRIERLMQDARPPLIYHGSRYMALSDLPCAPAVAKTPM